MMTAAVQHPPARARVRGFTALLLLAAATLFPGCATAPKAPEAVAFLTLSDTWGAAKHAMRGYAVQAVAGKVSQPDQDRIDAAFEKFRAALLVAVKLARYDWNHATPDDVDRLARDLLALIARLAPP